jgi:hypothetical protein
MAEVTDACSAVAETASQLVKGEAIHAAVSCDPGGSYSFSLAVKNPLFMTSASPQCRCVAFIQPINYWHEL